MLAVYPTMTLEKPQQTPATILINADGQAFSNGKGKPSTAGSSATLTLSGAVHTKGNGAFKLEALTGSLQVGSVSHAIVGGKGEINKNDKIEINAKTSDGARKLELVLHGHIQGDMVVFNRPESKLSPFYFLSLTGQLSFSTDTTTTSTTASGNGTVTVTVTQNNTVTETVTQIQDNTLTVTETANQTLTETVTQTVTETGANSTITVTETVTTTVANATITVTETVANTTLTVTQT